MVKDVCEEGGDEDSCEDGDDEGGFKKIDNCTWQKSTWSIQQHFPISQESRAT